MEYKKGDYIVYLGQGRMGKKTYSNDIPINYIFKFVRYQSEIYKNWVIAEWLGGNDYSAPPSNDFRLANPEEILLFEQYGKPVSIELVKNLPYEIY